MQTISPSLDDHKLLLTRKGLRLVPHGEGKGFLITSSNLFRARCHAINHGYAIDVDSGQFTDDEVWAWYLMCSLGDLRYDDDLSPLHRAAAAKEVLEFLSIEEKSKARMAFFKLIRRLRRLMREIDHAVALDAALRDDRREVAF